MTDERIREYWTQRAADSGGAAATTNDVWLRELEARVLAATLVERAPGARSGLDVGCGDGLTTLRVACARPDLRLTGVDFSPAMIELAERHRTATPEAGRVDFRIGDVRELSRVLTGQQFDIAMSDRCLINLEDLGQQRAALAEIARCVVPGGLYLAVENFLEGHRAMNLARATLGLSEIPVRWHNCFFDEPSFRDAAAPWFEIEEWRLFSSSYYLATRVLYSAYCRDRGEEPDYDHDLHRLAVDLPWTGDFGPVRLAVLRRQSG